MSASAASSAPAAAASPAAEPEHEHDEEEVSLTGWLKLISWRQVFVYGLLFGMAAYIGKQQYDKYAEGQAELVALEKRRKLTERMHPAPGGRFRVGVSI
jgi:hypothetical protein